MPRWSEFISLCCVKFGKDQVFHKGIGTVDISQKEAIVRPTGQVLSARISFNMDMMGDYAGILCIIIVLNYAALKTLWRSHSTSSRRHSMPPNLPLKPFSCSQQGLQFLALSIGSFSFPPSTRDSELVLRDREIWKSLGRRGLV